VSGLNRETMQGRIDPGTTGADDATIEAAVLRQLLALYPVQMTVDELVRELADEETEAGGADFALRDAVERAVRELGAAGLLHRNGEVVVPSRAALRFDELLG
jgi:hypothetical protein